MIRFQVTQKAIYIDLFEVLSLGVRQDNYWSNYRRCTVDGNEETGRFEVGVIEDDANPIKIGDLVRYDVHIDDYRVFKLSELEGLPNLIRV